MTLTLAVGKKEYTAKASFAFLKEVEKLGTYSEKTNKEEGGLETLLQGLVQNEPTSLVDFWVAATAHNTKKEIPSRSEIESALEEHIEENGLDELFKSAYNFMRNSGFFAKKVKTFWEMFEMAETLGQTDEEKEQNKSMVEYMMKLKAEIEA